MPPYLIRGEEILLLSEHWTVVVYVLKLNYNCCISGKKQDSCYLILHKTSDYSNDSELNAFSVTSGIPTLSAVYVQQPHYSCIKASKRKLKTKTSVSY